MREFNWVFLDLETTGIKPGQDKIIEIAAVSLSADGRREVFHQLVNPGMLIPIHITRLTGIDDSMVATAPAFEEIGTVFLRFLEGKVIVAHNAYFDMAFLEAAFGRALSNKYIDTLELARLLLPGKSSYSLKNLITVLELSVQPTHRALDDTLALESLFMVLLDTARKQTLEAVQEIEYFLQSEHGMALLFSEILRQKVKKYDFFEDRSRYKEQERKKDRWKKNGEGIIWDLGLLEKMMLPGGDIANGLPVYQKRDQQIKMLKAVGKAFVQERHLLVEAGTGVGKSLAYLVPALLWAYTQGEKVVVSTHTIALQEQLLHSEIDFLKKTMKFDFKAAVLKGRNNYICLQKWKAAKDNTADMSWFEKVMMARVGFWLRYDKSGDKDTIDLRDWEIEFYAQLASASESCRGAECPFVKDCFYQQAKQVAQQAELVIVNHSLLLLDLKLGESILPKYGYLVIDEAHHLEEEGTRQFSEVFSLKEFKRRIAQVYNRRDIVRKTGFLYFIKQRITLLKEKKDDVAGDLAKKVRAAEGCLSKISDTLDEIYEYFIEKQPAEIIRVQERTRTQHWWKNIDLLFDNLLLQLVSLLDCLDFLYKGIATELAQLEEDGLLREQKTLIDQIKTDYELGRRFFSENLDNGKVHWLEKDTGRNDLRLYITPLKTGQLFHDLLFSVKTSVVLTSATLSVEESFSFLMEELGIPDELADNIRIPSPFFYEEQALLLVDSSLPDPAKTSEEGYNLAVTEALMKILRVTGGNTLVLFTSHKQLRYIYEQLIEPLRQEGLELYADGISGRRNMLLNELKNNSKSVVFGASAFWEGIDLPGQSLTAVIMVKLPFSPPNLPLVEARVEELVKMGKNGFYHYSLPQAVLKFRQGYGRLIRTINDCGVIVVLDNRLISKNYGKTFIRSLPDQKYFSGDTPAIIGQIEQFFKNHI